MSNYDPYKSASDGQGYQPSVPSSDAYQPAPQPQYQAPEVPAYQPSADGWQSDNVPPAAQADSGYNPNGYASSYQPYAPAGSNYQPSVPSMGGTNMLAILSLVSSLVGFFFLWYIGPIAGIVLAHFARKQIRDTGEAGSGLATAGWWVGWVGIVLQVLFILGWIALFVLAIAAGGSSSYSGY